MKNKLQCPNCKNYNKLMNVGVLIMFAGLVSIGLAFVSVIFIITILLAPVFLVVGVLLILVGFITWLATRGTVRCMKCGWSGKKETARNVSL